MTIEYLPFWNQMLCICFNGNYVHVFRYYHFWLNGVVHFSDRDLLFFAFQNRQNFKKQLCVKFYHSCYYYFWCCSILKLFVLFPTWSRFKRHSTKNIFLQVARSFSLLVFFFFFYEIHLVWILAHNTCRCFNLQISITELKY